MDADKLRKLIQDDEYAIGALMLVYSYQTSDEQAVGGTMHDNGYGFNGTDGVFCSSLAQQYQRRQFLTEKQIVALRKLLPKYWKQLAAVKPMPNSPSHKVNKPKGKVATLNGKLIKVEFPFDHITINRVKLMPRRRWDKEGKFWEVPLTVDAVDDLIDMKFDIDSEVIAWHKKQTKTVEGVDLIIPGFKGKLRQFQADGVAFIESRNGRALLTDEMGLGKTIQALGWIQLRKQDNIFPAIVVCPSSLKIHWQREALRFTDINPVIISGKKEKEYLRVGDKTNTEMFIVNYDVIFESITCPDCKGKKTNVSGNVKCKSCAGKGKVTFLDREIAKLGAKTVILDECHYIKTSGSGRSIAAMELGSKANHVISLSGTPIVNRPVEFYNAINVTNPNILPSFWQYTARYCDRKHNGFGWNFQGATNTKELHDKLTRTIMLRRLKKDVLKQLPPKVRMVVPLEIDNKRYDKAMDKFAEELKGSAAQHLSIIEKAKQFVVREKMKGATEWIQNYIDNGDKIVLFAHHDFVVKQLEEVFKEVCVTVSGGTANSKRQEAVDRFQSDNECRIFIGTLAAIEGLTLTAAHATAFLELWWTPGQHDQAEDRVHRIGQDADSVEAYYLLAAGTIEEDIAELIDRKRNVLSKVLNGEKAEEESMLTELLRVILKEAA